MRKIIPGERERIYSRELFSPDNISGSESATCFRPATRRLIKAGPAHSLPVPPCLRRHVRGRVRSRRVAIKITESTATESRE